jgi:hypothetical protein
MKFINCAAQGDLLITRIEAIPETATKAQHENGVHVVAHSETGHHHVIDAAPVDYFHAANDSFVSYLRVNEPTNLRHLRSFDAHAPIQVQPGLYRINRQREYTPEGFRRAVD